MQADEIRLRIFEGMVGQATGRTVRSIQTH